MLSPLILFLATLFSGYLLSIFFSRPIEKNGQLKSNRLPQLKIKNLEITPNLRLHIGSRTYWIHHWSYLAVITLGMFVYLDSFSHLLAIKGVAIGGIIQGLRYPDRFKFRHPRLLK